MLKSRGAQFYQKDVFQPNSIDAYEYQLYTGQNPASSEGVAYGMIFFYLYNEEGGAARTKKEEL